MIEIDHVHIRASDYPASAAFYRAVLNALDPGVQIAAGDGWMECGAFYLDAVDPGAAPSRIHLCFAAPGRAAVVAFHEAGLAAGGRDNGPPGLRDYHPGYYAAFLLDPDGNNIEAKFDERI